MKNPDEKFRDDVVEINGDMKVLYHQLRTAKIEIRLATELANIAGKRLKALQLQLAQQVFLQGENKPAAIEHAPSVITHRIE